MCHEIIPCSADLVRFVGVTVTTIGHYNQVEVLVVLYELIDYKMGHVRMHIGIHGAVGEQQPALKVFNLVLQGLIVQG